MTPSNPSKIRRRAAPIIEVIAAAAVILIAGFLGAKLGWRGRPKTAISTALWPFYFDTWFNQTVWTGRALLPLLGLAVAWLPLRRYLSERGRGDLGALFGVIAAAWMVHLFIGAERHGVEAGLKFTFSRVQEYWQDVHLVKAGFLSTFPDVGPLSQHGGTHPPGTILFLAGLRALGFTHASDASLASSLLAAATALPLYGAARRLADEEIARWTAALFLFACSVTAFAVLSMDVLTMFLGAVALYGMARAREGDPWGGVIWGLGLAAASLCTFTALTLGLTYAVLLAPQLKKLDARRIRALALGPLAFLAFYGLLVLIFQYRPFHVFDVCWRAFNASDDASRSYRLALLGSPIAFLGSLGLPLMALVARSVGGAVLRLRNSDERPTVTLVLAAALPVAVCIALGKPRAEVERIYLLFVPALVLAAATAARRWYQRSPAWVTDFAVPILVIQSILVEVYYNTLW